MKLALVLLLCTVLDACLGYNRCYVCNSRDTAKCGDPYMSTWKSDILYMIAVEGTSEMVMSDCVCCTKTKDGDEYVTRDCVRHTSFNHAVCYVSITTYTCSEDYCNAATPITRQSSSCSAYSVLISLACLLFLVWQIFECRSDFVRSSCTRWNKRWSLDQLICYWTLCYNYCLCNSFNSYSLRFRYKLY